VFGVELDCLPDVDYRRFPDEAIARMMTHVKHAGLNVDRKAEVGSLLHKGRNIVGRPGPGGETVFVVVRMELDSFRTVGLDALEKMFLPPKQIGIDRDKGYESVGIATAGLPNLSVANLGIVMKDGVQRAHCSAV